MPGRHEPGSGTIGWSGFMETLRGLSYTGPIGLEYKPTGPTLETLTLARESLGI